MDCGVNGSIAGCELVGVGSNPIDPKVTAREIPIKINMNIKTWEHEGKVKVIKKK